MISQAQRFAFVTCPLGENTLLFHQMTGHEEMGRLFEYEIELLSEQQHMDINQVLGQPMTLTLELPQKNKRDYHGYVTQFRQHGTLGDLFRYRAVLRPWLWFLTRHSHCRIFQELSIPDILKQVFQTHGFSDVELNLSQSYPVRDYCVQYRETDFNFVSRLMEQEGMYYFFTHQPSKHTLVIADSVNTYQLIPDYDKIEFFPEENVEQREVEHIFQWDTHHEMQAGSYTLNDFDFKKPQADLFTKFAAQKAHHYADGEYYDYPGNYTEVNVGETYATTRLDELHSQHEIIYGRGNARGISCGMQFALKNHYRTLANTQYVVVAADFFIRSNAYGSQQSGDFSGYECSFQAMPATQTFRPRRITPVPFVQGPQTAVVVGKEGEEIWTDKYGRVKVQFHWDRDGKKNEASSCWIRVATPVAGKQWGWVSVPRIGQEVVVSFLEGNPDRPLITGSVYNANQMPPYALPANQTQSGIKTRSSKTGTPENFNELRFEDKKGSEQVYLHAEKNQTFEVEHNESHWVGHDRSKTVEHNETVTIGKNRSESVTENETISIGKNRSEDVSENETISVGKNRQTSVGENENLDVGKNREHSVAENETLTIGKKHTIEIGETRQTTVGKDDLTQVSKKFYLEAGDELTLKSGDASITLKKDGTIQIKGKGITIVGSDKIGIKASADLVLKGSKIAEN